MTIDAHNKGTLEVSGTGAINVVPDMATLRLSVVTDSKTASDAVAGNAKDANNVIDRVVKVGIPRGEMSTEGLNLYPLYETDPRTGTTALVGYRASNTVSVKAPIELAGKVFDAAVEAGADESSGLSFGLRDPGDRREKALESAVAAARKEAELVSKAMGVKLVGPKTIQIISEGGGPIRFESVKLAKGATPVLPGSLTIAATVHVVFETLY